MIPSIIVYHEQQEEEEAKVVSRRVLNSFLSRQHTLSFFNAKYLIAIAITKCY